jgi:gamma-glutamylcyclotransferase (GGCT)/AIG2-like uncharacterized protein YtfP
MFVYGSLSFNDVLAALLGHEVQGEPAAISGFQRVRLVGKAYPGLIKGTGEVEGVLHEGVSAEDVAIVDAFERELYERLAEPVKLRDGREVRAGVYVLSKKGLDIASSELWDRAQFDKTQRGDYLEMVCRYRLNYLKGVKQPQV